MANKFQKSVLERLEQEAKLQKKNSSEPLIMEQSDFTTITETRVRKLEMPQPDDTTISQIEDVSQELTSTFSAYLRHEPERHAKNKTFYLDVEVIDSIRSTARSQKLTDSKLVNDILRGVLGIR